MKSSKRKIHWTTKFVSNKNYIREVSIDGKETNRFNYRVGYYELYIEQVMRTGNCLTLLSIPPAFSLETFNNANLFEDVAKYVFWTFNAAFLNRIERYLPILPLRELKDCYAILQANPEPYLHIEDNEPDEELVWCKVKNENLKKDEKFVGMYQKDATNRHEVLRLLEKVISSFIDAGKNNKAETNAPLFPQMLNPAFGTVENTLAYIESKIIEAKFPHNIFKTIEKTKKGNNQTGLNAEIAAMVYVFQQKEYFKKEFTFKDIFKTFGKYTDNQAGKDYDYYSFSHDKNFKKYLDLLQTIEIKDFSTL